VSGKQLDSTGRDARRQACEAGRGRDGAGDGPAAATDVRLETALELHRLGYWPVAIYPKGVEIGGVIKKGKEPIGNGWGLERWTIEKLRRKFAANPGAGAGICFGPRRAPDGRWLIDLEGDGPSAARSLAIVLGVDVPPVTLSWDSRRGFHVLFVLDEADALRLLALLAAAGAKEGTGIKVGVWHLDALPDLEWRIGGYKPDGVVKQVQSVVPPTAGEDDTPRTWKVGPDAPVATLPSHVFEALEALAADGPAGPPLARKTSADGRAATDGKAASNGRHPDLPASSPEGNGRPAGDIERRVIAYLAKVEPAISGQKGHNKTFGAACRVGPGFDLTEEQAYRLLDAHYNPRCQPPWSEKELRHKVADAYKNAKSRGWLLEADRKEDRRAAAGQQYPGYILNEDEAPVKCVSNTITWLSLHRPGWVRYDSFLGQVLLDGDPMIDHAVIELQTEIEASLGTGWPKNHVEDALIALGHRDTFSPLAEYLESLEWDGENRLELFFIDHYEVEDTPYHREVGRVLFLSAVARGLDPGCKVDTVVLMMGRQDLHKSLGIAALCPRDEWFTDNIGDLDGGVETAKRLGGKWLVELSELAAMKKNEVETIKSFISTQVDNYRPSYGRANQDFPRSCIFIGTTNSDQPLQDVENRRFLPVKIIDKGKLALIESNRDQLWAEAVHRWKRGEKWWITSDDLVEEAKEQAETARAIDAWEDILRERLGGYVRTTVPEAADLLRIPLDRLGRPDQIRIGNILKKIGFGRAREPSPPRTWFYERVSVPT
jgi:hypothetical protein